MWQLTDADESFTVVCNRVLTHSNTDATTSGPLVYPEEQRAVRTRSCRTALGSLVEEFRFLFQRKSGLWCTFFEVALASRCTWHLGLLNQREPRGSTPRSRSPAIYIYFIFTIYAIRHHTAHATCHTLQVVDHVLDRAGVVGVCVRVVLIAPSSTEEANKKTSPHDGSILI